MLNDPDRFEHTIARKTLEILRFQSRKRFSAEHLNT
jgi:hypothetical protein